MKQDHGDRRSWGGDQTFPLLYHSAALQTSWARQCLGAVNAGCVLAHRWCEDDLPFPEVNKNSEFYDLRLTQPPFARTPLIFLICS